MNWANLDEPERAHTAKVWFQVSLAVALICTFLALVRANEQALRVVGLLYLVTWYFAAARPQIKHVLLVGMVAVTAGVLGRT